MRRFGVVSLMKCFPLGVVVAGILISAGSVFAEAAAVQTGAADALRAKYVEGLQVVSDVQAMLERSGGLLELQESATDAHRSRVNQMDWRARGTKEQLESLAKEAKRSAGERERLLAEHGRILERFTVLERTLVDRRTLVKGATEAVSTLMALAEKSGQLNERQLAERMVSEMKAAAENLQRTSDQVEDTKLRLGLEFTLVQGMEPRVPLLASEIEKLLKEQAELSAQLGKHLEAVNKLESGVQADRGALDGKVAAFAKTTETFRLAQVEVLRRWLLSGPPEGDWPELSALDMLEAGQRARKQLMPPPGLTALGGVADYADALPAALEQRMTGTRRSAVNEGELGESNAALVKQHKRVRWYLAMIERLLTLTRESVGNANNWIDQARGWNSTYLAQTRQLAQQQGELAGLATEAGSTALTVELTAKQAATVSGKVGEATRELDKHGAALAKITMELFELAK